MTQIRSDTMAREIGSTGLFGFAGTTIMWNCCCRSETLDILHLEHFDWENDCLKLTILKTKMDQGGVDADIFSPRTRHIFAAPNKPMSCPILAIALYAFSQSRMRTCHTKFFLGNDQKQRFGQVLRRVLSTEDMQEEVWRDVGKC